MFESPERRVASRLGGSVPSRARPWGLYIWETLPVHSEETHEGVGVYLGIGAVTLFVWYRVFRDWEYRPPI